MATRAESRAGAGEDPGRNRGVTIFRGTSYLEAYGTPYDELTPGFIEGIILTGYQQSKGPVMQTDFGANLPQLFAGMGSVLDRGLRLIACFDHTQYTTPTEHKIMQLFQAKYPKPWQDQDCVTGTSSAGAGLIAHAKRRVYNALIDGYDVPDKPYGYYQSLGQCWQDGYPVVELGSANMTTKGMEQVNDVLFIPSKDMARFYQAQIQQEHDWIVQMQQRYQPNPRSTPALGQNVP